MIDQSAVLFADPLIPRPPVSVVALREAVECLDAGGETARFDRELVQFEEAAASGVGDPMRTFLRSWQLWVERNRFPAVQEQIRGLEIDMHLAKSLEEGRAVATRMSRLLYAVSDPVPWT